MPLSSLLSAERFMPMAHPRPSNTGHIVDLVACQPYNVPQSYPNYHLHQFTSWYLVPSSQRSSQTGIHNPIPKHQVFHNHQLAPPHENLSQRNNVETYGIDRQSSYFLHSQPVVLLNNYSTVNSHSWDAGTITSVAAGLPQLASHFTPHVTSSASPPALIASVSPEDSPGTARTNATPESLLGLRTPYEHQLPASVGPTQAQDGNQPTSYDTSTELDEIQAMVVAWSAAAQHGCHLPEFRYPDFPLLPDPNEPAENQGMAFFEQPEPTDRREAVINSGLDDETAPQNNDLAPELRAFINLTGNGAGNGGPVPMHPASSSQGDHGEFEPIFPVEPGHGKMCQLQFNPEEDKDIGQGKGNNLAENIRMFNSPNIISRSGLTHNTELQPASFASGLATSSNLTRNPHHNVILSSAIQKSVINPFINDRTSITQSRLERLLAHARSLRPKKNVHHCSIAGCSFTRSRKANVAAHEKTHLPKEAYTIRCLNYPNCVGLFPDERALRRHMKNNSHYDIPRKQTVRRQSTGNQKEKMPKKLVADTLVRMKINFFEEQGSSVESDEIARVSARRERGSKDL